jgi:hypothetical protein
MVVRRSVAVPLLLDGNQLLDYLELERRYRKVKQLVVDYLVEKYGEREPATSVYGMK